MGASLPAYGSGALCDVAPSALAALDVPGQARVFDYPQQRAAAVLLIDGLGFRLLHQHAEHAPFLTSLAGFETPITTGFPTTTASSIASLTTGAAPGEHGVVGYTFRAGGHLLNALRWTDRKGTDLREKVPPEELAPTGTVFELAARHGVTPIVIAPGDQRRSGLSRAVLRGAEFTGTIAHGDLIAAVHAALRRPGRVFCYAYLAELDSVGHVYGPGSPAWLAQLRLTDRLVELLATGLPAGCGLSVVADHGMVALDDAEVIEFDDEPELADGVAEVAGEIRCRYLYVADGALSAVASTWRARPGYRVLERDEAIAEGLFGASVRDDVRGRIGDLLVIPTRLGGVRCRSRERRESRLPGQHGALTEAELLVPRLTHMS